MKTRQDGSMAAVVAVTITAVGLTAMTVQNYRSSAKNTVAAANVRRDSDKKHEAAINAAARFKALLSPREQGGRYIPGFLATNYFDDNWSLKQNGNLSVAASLASANSVSMNLASDSTQEMKQALKVLANGESAVSAAGSSSQPYTVQIINVNRDNASAMDLVTSVDIKVTTKEGGKVLSNSFRVPMQAPEARDPVLKYRKKNTGSYQTVTGDMTLDPGTYQFQAFGSGIVYYAKITQDTDENIKGVVNGKPTHRATTWDSEDQAIGDPVEVTVGQALTNQDIQFDQSSCSESGTTESVSMPPSHKVRMQLYGVDGKLASGGNNNREFTVKTNVAATAYDTYNGVTVHDYQTKCTEQCPYLGDTYDPSQIYGGDTIGAHFSEAKLSGKDAGDMTDAWVYQEAHKYGITQKKVCFNLDDDKSIDLNDEHYFEKGHFYAYSVNTCRRQFLMARDNCGCVSEDTKILMGDGKTEKRIDQIAEGDKVWNPVLKKAMPIHHLSRGPEKVPLLTIKTAGDELNATGNHPFPTRSGMKTAFQLEVGEEIQLASGRWAKIEAIKVKGHEAGHAPVVWNIEIDAPADNWDAHHYVANGIDTGDLFIQRTLESGKLSARN